MRPCLPAVPPARASLRGRRRLPEALAGSRKLRGTVAQFWNMLPRGAAARRAESLTSVVLLSNMPNTDFRDNPEKVENNGFEPLTLCLQSRCSSQLS